jgi:hypothetical protein
VPASRLFFESSSHAVIAIVTGFEAYPAKSPVEEKPFDLLVYSLRSGLVLLYIKRSTNME